MPDEDPEYPKTGETPFEVEGAVRLPPADVLDLHSIRDEDVRPAVEEFLLEARRHGFRYLRIIHGRGRGVRRAIVRSILARSSLVEHFADAPMEAGGWGATVVTLRPAASGPAGTSGECTP